MKLNEIFDVKQTDKKIPIDHSNNDIIGSGYYASVYDNKKDPHTVIKQTDYDPHDTDGYDIFVQEMLKHEMWKENPCFPRIYVRSAPNNSGKGYIMERLTPYRQIEPEILLNYRNDNFSPESDTKYHADIDQIQLDMSSIMISGVTNLGFRVLNAKITNPHIEEAVNFCKNLARQHRCKFDLHRSNFMYRRGPYGIQLVITDPLA